MAYDSTTNKVLFESTEVMLLAVNIKITRENVTVYGSYRSFLLLPIQTQQVYDIQNRHQPGCCLTAVVLRSMIREMRNLKIVHNSYEKKFYHDFYTHKLVS